MFGWRRKSTTPQAAQNTNENAPVETPSAQRIADAMTLEKFDVIVGSCSDVGCVRELNEDSARCVFLDEAPSAAGRARRGVLLIVADGMGGHAGGEVASLLAVETISREYSGQEYSDGAEDRPDIALRAALERANAAIFSESKRDKSKRGMGTTGTALVLRGEHAWYAHAGDSRLYLARGGEIYQLSQDHSPVMDMVRQGLLTIEQARTHENKNLITRALGLHAHVEIETWDEPFPIRTNDRFLLCSDGLHDLVEDEMIKTLVLQNEPQIACENLVAAAKGNGGYDNVTAIIAHVQERAQSGGKSSEEVIENNDETPVTREMSAVGNAGEEGAGGGAAETQL